MRIIPLALVMLSLAPSATALAQRQSTRTMTCAAARNLVVTRGAIVLSTGPDLYDRYVSNQGACAAGQIERPSFAPTLDNPACALGSVCVTRPESDH